MRSWGERATVSIPEHSDGRSRKPLWKSCVVHTSVWETSVTLAGRPGRGMFALTRKRRGAPVRACACGCGESVSGTFRSGHDSRLRAGAEMRAGGAIRLARLVDAFEELESGAMSHSDFGRRVKQSMPAAGRSLDND